MIISHLRAAAPSFLIPVCLGAFLVLWAPSLAPQATATRLSGATCTTAEDCFRSALAVPPSSADLTHEQLLNMKVERLRRAEHRDPASLWAKRARLLRAELLKERDPTEALRLLIAIQPDWEVLEDYVRFWTAEALSHLGGIEEAARQFESIPRKVPDTVLKAQAAFRGGALWYQADQCSNAIELLGRAVALEPDDPLAAAALMRVADCQVRQVRTADGLATLERVWAEYPDAPEAIDAMARLNARASEGTWHPTADQLYKRAESLFQRTLYMETIETWREFLPKAAQHPKRDEARYKLALAHARLKQYDDAQQIFQELVDERTAESGKAAVWLARIYVRQGDGAQLLALPRLFGVLPLSAQQQSSILLYLGVWLEDEGKESQAISAYLRAARTAPGSTVRLKALWRIGWLQYRTGELPKAVATFQEGLKSGAENGWSPRFLYWQARALERLEDPQAIRTYAGLCRRYPLTYYGQLVSSCAKAFVSEAATALAPESASAGSNGNLAELGRNVHYHKALELQQLGLDDLAGRELLRVSRQGIRGRRALLELSVHLSAVGDHHEALRVAKIYFPDYLDGARTPQSSMLWQVAYPTTYLPVIRSYTKNHVDPYLVAAIIREESLYDTDALSRAGAVGLMQIMPTTAQTLIHSSQSLDTIRDELLDYDTNIRLGSQYLGNLLTQFSGNLMHAVAAYNAGPSAVSRWVARNGSAEPAEFVELIPYRETRGYVKRVLRSYREYHRLEESGCPDHSLDKGC